MHGRQNVSEHSENILYIKKIHSNTTLVLKYQNILYSVHVENDHYLSVIILARNELESLYYSKSLAKLHLLSKN